MSLNWIGLGNVGVPLATPNKPLEAEAKSINEAVGAVHKLRAKADRESDEINAVWQSNKGVDRTALFAAIAAAYEAEVAVRERIAVFYQAVQIAGEAAKQKAREELAKYEAAAMKAYNLSPDQPFPAAMKQTDHVWQETFRKRCEAESFTIQEPLRQNASILLQVAPEAIRYRNLHASEKRRVESQQAAPVPSPTIGELQLDASRERRQTLYDKAMELLGSNSAGSACPASPGRSGSIAAGVAHP